MAGFVAGTYFLRFWKETRDQLFLMFALSFWILSFLRIALALPPATAESTTYLYFVRLLAYLLILVAILRKNVAKQ